MNNNIFSISAFLYGLPVGFAFSFALGLVFFLLIKASLENGFRAALYIAIGVVVADMTLLGIAYGGVETLLPNHVNVAFWAQLFGGLLLIGIGVATIAKKPKNTEGALIEPSNMIIKNIARGFFLNILNPANFFEWVGTALCIIQRCHKQKSSPLSISTYTFFKFIKCKSMKTIIQALFFIAIFVGSYSFVYEKVITNDAALLMKTSSNCKIQKRMNSYVLLK